MLENINFTYNNISSTSLNLLNVTLSSGLFEEPLLSKREAIVENIRGRDKSYFFGIQREPLTFKLSFAFDEKYTDSTLRQIAKWLDQTTYKPFYFNDVPERIYYCILVGEPALQHNGNNEGYIELEFLCDSPYAYGTLTTGTVLTPTSGTTITFNNQGDVDLYPEIWIVTTSVGNVSITNQTSGDSAFTFENLASVETIYCDCENQYIETDIPLLYRYNNFNNNYLRLIPGNNTLLITGNFTLQFRYKFKYLQGTRTS